MIMISPSVYCGKDGFSSSSSSNSNADIANVLLFAAVAQNAVTEIERLVELKKANVNAKNNEGATPLHCAVCYGNFEAAGKLVELGAKIGIANDYGDTPLHIACSGEVVGELVMHEENNRNSKDVAKRDVDFYNTMVKVLLRAHNEEIKEAINKINNAGCAPLDILYEVRLNRFILEKTKESLSPEAKEVIEGNKAKVLALITILEEKYGAKTANTLLYDKLGKGDLFGMASLVKSGVAIDVPKDNGNTFFHEACYVKTIIDASGNEVDCVDVVRTLLLLKGCKKKDERGQNVSVGEEIKSIINNENLCNQTSLDLLRARFIELKNKKSEIMITQMMLEKCLEKSRKKFKELESLLRKEYGAQTFAELEGKPPNDGNWEEFYDAMSKSAMPSSSSSSSSENSSGDDDEDINNLLMNPDSRWKEN